MSFRPARLVDADLILAWRTEAEGQPWYEGVPVTDWRHRNWLLPRLQSQVVKLLIWEENGVPVGMVRIDSNGEFAFSHDGDPLPMLKAALPIAAEYGDRLKATLDADDPKVALLEAAGFRRYPAVFLAYRPDANAVR